MVALLGWRPFEAKTGFRASGNVRRGPEVNDERFRV
jgi:hypothetical protein